MVRSLGIRYSKVQTSFRQADGDRHQEAPRAQAGPEIHRQDVAPRARHLPEDKEEERAGGLLEVRPQLHRRHLPPGEAQAHEERLASLLRQTRSSALVARPTRSTWRFPTRALNLPC